MSTSTAHLETQPYDLASELPAWRVELNAKLEAHRQRRPASQSQPLSGACASEGSAAARGAASRVAARVAERYANAPSYRDVLAANAATAAAAAEAAAVAAQQAHEAAQVLMTSLSGPQSEVQQVGEQVWEKAWEEVQPEADWSGLTARSAAGSRQARCVQADGGPAVFEAPGRSAHEFSGRIEHPEPLPPRSTPPPRSQAQTALGGIVDPFAEASVFPALGLPAKLIEFPRELIATRKARPRVAEGPLAEASFSEAAETDRAQDFTALRIFEVEGAAGQQDQSAPLVNRGTHSAADTRERDSSELRAESTPDGRLGDGAVRSRHAEGDQSPLSPERGPQADPASRAPEWQSIRLGAHPDLGNEAATLNQPGRQSVARTAAPLHAAPIGDRAMAALVDLAIIGAAFLVFVLVFASCTAHPPVDKVAFACAGALLAALAVFYQWLFMSYGGGTLGMRYAGIALCTFEDGNPTRSMLRTRVGASVLCALPLGLGLLWAIFDEDGLGWHDRLSGCYQRSYR